MGDIMSDILCKKNSNFNKARGKHCSLAWALTTRYRYLLDPSFLFFGHRPLSCAAKQGGRIFFFVQRNPHRNTELRDFSES